MDLSSRYLRRKIGQGGPLLGGFLLCALCLLATPASAEGGSFDNGFTWDLTDGLLTITGSGPMPDFPQEQPPWRSYCDNITSAVVSDGVTTIGNYAFIFCDGLTSVKLPASLETIGNYVFYDCFSLVLTSLPSGVTTIGNYAFYRCDGLTLTSLPSGVTTIGDYAFHGCDGLTLTSLPSGVTTIEPGAFGMCVSLETMDLSECTRLTKIDSNAFMDCVSLRQVELPAGLETIERDAFFRCISLASVELPAGVEEVRERAFWECSQLAAVTFTSTTAPTLGNDVFENCASPLTVYFPAEGAASYEAALNGKLPSGVAATPGYFVTVTSGAHGTASADFVIAPEGETVTLTAAPDSGWQLKEWQVDSGGVTAVENNTFTMPGENVEITAVFEEVSAPPPHVHSWSSSWSSDAGGHWHACGCGARRDEVAHTPGAWVVDQEASYSQEGQRHRACTVCGYVTETETVPRREDSGGDSSSDDDSRDESGFRPSTPPAQGGGVALSPSRPEKGDTVTVFPRPKDGYEVESVTVTGPDGRQLEVRRNEDGSFRFTQPEGGVTVQASFRPVRETEETLETPEWVSPFSDVRPGDWYYEAVRFVCENELMNGYADGRFAPGAPLSRAQLAQILYNRESRPAVTGGGGFTDVAAGSWCGAAVRWAADRGIVTGYADGRFAPDAPVTREQLAQILYNREGRPTVTGGGGFTDVAAGSWCGAAVRWAAAAGVLSGYGDGRLNPKGQATRAQTAQMLKNYMGN